MRLPDGRLQIPHRRTVGHDDMDIDPQPVGVKADGVLDAVEPIERVDRRLGVEDHPPFGVDAGAASGEQVVALLLLDAVARSVEPTYELRSLIRNPYAVFCLTQKHVQRTHTHVMKTR